VFEEARTRQQSSWLKDWIKEFEHSEVFGDGGGVFFWRSLRFNEGNF